MGNSTVNHGNSSNAPPAWMAIAKKRFAGSRGMRLPSGHLVAWLALLLLAGPGPDAAGQTALDTYVATPDSSFDWVYDDNNTIYGTGYTAYVLDMTSQTWRTASEVDYPVWQHWMQVIVPDGAPSDTAVLFIDGGSRRALPPTAADSDAVSLAMSMNAITVHLPTVPNQALEFSNDGVFRKEDEIISYTYNEHLNGGDDTWPLLLPMVKSAVGAMDATQEFTTLEFGPTQGVNDFVVMGASKRGWTTWLTGAYDAYLAPEDRRVKAIMPWVIDVLNIDEQMAHHKVAYEGVTENMYGGYSVEVHDYVDMNVMDRLSTIEGQALLKIVDPYEYRDRYADIPKYMVNGTGDEFFVPDSAQFYFDDLPGDKYMRYVPNVGHGAAGEAMDSITAFYEAVTEGGDLPEFSWTLEDGGRAIRVMVASLGDADGVEVKLWQASNPESRDFRWYDGTGPHWSDTVLDELGIGEYLGGVEFPETGATAFMLELAFDRGLGVAPYIFTTQVSVFVPEPSPAVLLLSLGLVALLVYGYRRRVNRHPTNTNPVA
jgi:PhoPQ-activated pathogenicity-related protein